LYPSRKRPGIRKRYRPVVRYVRGEVRMAGGGGVVGSENPGR